MHKNPLSNRPVVFIQLSIMLMIDCNITQSNNIIDVA